MHGIVFLIFFHCSAALPFRLLMLCDADAVAARHGRQSAGEDAGVVDTLGESQHDSIASSKHGTHHSQGRTDAMPPQYSQAGGFDPQPYAVPDRRAASSHSVNAELASLIATYAPLELNALAMRQQKAARSSQQPQVDSAPASLPASAAADTALRGARMLLRPAAPSAEAHRSSSGSRAGPRERSTAPRPASAGGAEPLNLAAPAKGTSVKRNMNVSRGLHGLHATLLLPMPCSARFPSNTVPCGVGCMDLHVPACCIGPSMHEVLC